jgi:hypothetical protein
MCQHISWIELFNGAVLFLTDKEVFSEEGRLRLSGTLHNDIVGHGAIRTFYGLSRNEGIDYEVNDFWNKERFPKEIAQYLESPQTFLNTWGRMLRIKGAVEPSTAFSIMTTAPKLWRDGLFDLLVNIILEERRFSCLYEFLRDLKGLTGPQRAELVEGVSQNAEYSYYTLLNVKGLTDDQKEKLIESVLKDVNYSYWVLKNVEGLTDDQKEKLIESVLTR